MLRKIWKAAATQRARSRERARLAVVAVTAGLALAGCAAPAQIIAQRDPADLNAPVKPVTYRSTLGPYQSARPVDPAPWGAQNQRVTPQPKSE
jgi:hypothetical protein